ncbi:MAG: DUF6600 domain-containing protein, partial [Verrucomicrobiota bacterium]
HAPLAEHGYWVDVQQYGRCWYPAYVGQGWRPYANGQWVSCDAGWYWETAEPWGWATYHYGRWTWDSYYGWLWVPDVVWAPAWVSWREGDAYVGWAPLPPRCDVYAERVVVPNFYFVFVEHRHFCAPIQPRVLVVNQTIINQTVNITKIKNVNNVVINQGPSVQTIERSNPGRVTKVKIERPAPAEFRQGRPDSQPGRAPAKVDRPVVSQVRNEQPAPVYPTDRDKKEWKQTKGDNHRAPVPPQPVVVQPYQPLPPTAAQPPASDYSKGKKKGHDKPSDDDEPSQPRGR